MDKDLASSKDYVPKLKWVAISCDGSILSSDDHSSEDIDRRNLKSIMIVDTDGNPVITQHYFPGQRMIYRARTAMRTGIGVLDRIHILGWEENGVEHVAFIAESDKSIEMGRFIPPDHPLAKEKPWHYEIELAATDLIRVEPPSHNDPDKAVLNPDKAPVVETVDESFQLGPGPIRSSTNSRIQ